MVAAEATCGDQREAERRNLYLSLAQQGERGNEREDEGDSVKCIGDEGFATLLEGPCSTSDPCGEAVRDGEVAATEVEVLEARPTFTE